jgi:hypothetical protein
LQINRPEVGNIRGGILTADGSISWVVMYEIHLRKSYEKYTEISGFADINQCNDTRQIGLENRDGCYDNSRPIQFSHYSYCFYLKFTLDQAPGSIR